MIPKRLIAVGLAFAVALAASGCSSAGGGQQAAGDTPVQGGTLTYGDIEFQTDFQLQKAFNYTQANIFRNIADRLTYYDTEQKQVVGWLADTFEANADNTQFTFHIRSGVTFSDGTALTPDVVKKNLDQLGLGDEEKKIPKNRDFINYASSEVSGENVIVHFSAPNSEFLRAVSAATSSILGEKTLDLDAAGQSKIENVVGSGAFVFESQVPDEQITLTRRDDYAWAPETAENQGAAYLDTVVFRAVSEVGLRAGAVASGELDVARGIQPSDEQAVTEAGEQLIAVDAPDLTANWAAARGDADIVSDSNVRRALAIGFDREALKSTVLSDSYQISGSVLNHSAVGFVELSDELAYDPDEANRLLDEAGWVTGDDGIRVKDGKRLSISVAASPRSVVIKPAFEFIEQEWRKIGVELVNNSGDSTIFANALGDRTYPLIASRQFYSGGLSPLFSTSDNTNTYYSNPATDELFQQELAATDTAQKDEISAQIQRNLVVEDSLVIPLWDEVQVHAARSDVHITFDGGTAPILQEAWVNRSDS